MLYGLWRKRASIFLLIYLLSFLWSAIIPLMTWPFHSAALNAGESSALRYVVPVVVSEIVAITLYGVGCPIAFYLAVRRRCRYIMMVSLVPALSVLVPVLGLLLLPFGWNVVYVVEVAFLLTALICGVLALAAVYVEVSRPITLQPLILGCGRDHAVAHLPYRRKVERSWNWLLNGAVVAGLLCAFVGMTGTRFLWMVVQTTMEQSAEASGQPLYR
jgi:uncharacterized Tic20 family protein